MIAVWKERAEPLEATELEARIASLAEAAGTPFAARYVTVLDEISRRILRHPKLRTAPQYVALAFWLRRASMQRLADRFAAQQQPGKLSGARGIALHLPPTNVDTIFVYSWAMALLTGNANVVRLPDSLKPETEMLVILLTGILADLSEGERQLSVSYTHLTLPTILLV